MGLGMSLTPRLTVACECDVCGGTTEEHKGSCPIEAMNKAMAARVLYSCPKCHRSSRVELNMTDWFECRDCHAQFSTGIAPDAPESLEHVYLIGNDAVQAVVLKQKGDGKYRIDELCRTLRAEATRRRAERKAARQSGRRGPSMW